jgi:hypothetical protein
MRAIPFDVLQNLYASTHEGRTVSANAIDFARKIETYLASQAAPDAAVRVFVLPLTVASIIDAAFLPANAIGSPRRGRCS